jgi:hypothetical protein
MFIPKGQAVIAFVLSAVVILGGAQLMMPAGLQLAEAQTTACVAANPDEVPNLAITVTYLPNAAAFPAEQAVEVQRRLNSGPWTNLPNLPANARAWVDNSVVQGTVIHQYDYRERVVNADGASPWSDIGCFSYPRILRPPPIPILVISAVKKGA